MSYNHVLKLAGKFIIRGFIFKAGKKAAIRGGKIGIGAASLLAGGYLAYQLLEEQKKYQKEKEQKKQLSNDDKKIIV